MNSQTNDSPTQAELVKRILSIWFLDETTGSMDLPQKKRWFMSTPEFDEMLRQEFVSQIRQNADDFKSWQHSPQSCLAYIVLLDQFTRNIFRGTADAFAYDPLALNASLYALEHEYDKQLPLTHRLFVYLPLEHDETLTSQEKALNLFLALQEAADDTLSEFASATLKSAYEHKEIIERFGRFPHRNKVLGRESTDAEIQWLNDHNKRFGQ